MKTDELIKVLSTNVDSVDSRQVMREIALAAVIGTLLAVSGVLIVRGLRADLDEARALAFFLLKLAFAVAVVVTGSFYLIKLARPGGEDGTKSIWVAWPIVGMTLLAIISLVAMPVWHWNNLVMGKEWLECLVSIPLIAIAPFVVVVWVMRRMAPTDLVRAGALVGFVSGGISAIGYAVHCTGDSLPFIALWYGCAIALCALAGAALGPRLLRW